MLTIALIQSLLLTLRDLLPAIVFVVAVLVVISVIALLSLRVLEFQRLLKLRVVLLELTPPAGGDKTPGATQKLFSVLHGLDPSRSSIERVLRRKVVLSLEVVSTKTGGIRYLMRVPESEASNIERTINSYMPDVRCKRIDDYLSDSKHASNFRVAEVKQSGHFAYPLRFQEEFGEYDSMAYLAGAMTKLEEGEMMALQIVLSPTHVPEARSISRRIMHNEELIYALGQRRLSGLGSAARLINSMLFSVLDTVGEVTSGGRVMHSPINTVHDVHQQQAAMKIRPARVLSVFEQKLAESVHDKLNQPLFRVQIRALIRATSDEAERQRAKGIRDWLALFSVPGYQSLKVAINWPWIRRYRLLLARYRLPSFTASKSLLLSASEVADLYHFPHNQAAKVENVVKSLSKTLPAPISLKGNPNFEVVLGRNHHHGVSTDIGLSAAERERHVYIIGGTGNGKTTMLEYAIVQDMRNGKGVAVVDPHGDLAERLLGLVPEDRINDVIYFNPSDLGFPIGLNLLELPEGLSGDELLNAKDFITETVVSLMRKIFSDDDTGGHRIEYVLRNTVHTALTIEAATIFTVYDLLTDTKYRNLIVKGLKDQKLKNFWKNEVGKAGDFQRVKMSAGVTNKIGRFQFSVSAERIMSQAKSTINFDEILDGKILICNFAKGLLGEDTSSLFGISTLAKLQLAAYRRVNTDPSERRPFYLYVDEFQNFATMSFVQLLSEARKYKVFLTMVEQSTSQQEQQRMVNTILANVGTIVCFRTGSPADEQFMLPFFEPYVQQGEISSLPTYNFYARIPAIVPQEPVSGETLLSEAAPSGDMARKVVEESRANYAKKSIVADEAVKHTKPLNKLKQNSMSKPERDGSNSEGFPGGANSQFSD